MGRKPKCTVEEKVSAVADEKGIRQQIHNLIKSKAKKVEIYMTGAKEIAIQYVESESKEQAKATMQEEKPEDVYYIKIDISIETQKAPVSNN